MLVLAVALCLAVSVNAQSLTYTWSGGNLALYNYATFTNGTVVCNSTNMNTTVVGTASGSSLLAPTTLGCIASAVSGFTYTVSCDQTQLNAGSASSTTWNFEGTEYLTGAAGTNCNASPRTGATGRTFSAVSSTLTPTLNSLGMCKIAWDPTVPTSKWNFIGTCTSGASSIIPSVVVVAVAFAAAVFTTKA